MKTYHWFSLLSVRQRIILLLTIIISLAIVVFGFLMHRPSQHIESISFTPDMSIRQIAPQLGVTGKSLARELNLSLDVSKNKPVAELNITDEELAHVVDHLLSHVDATAAYYVFFVLVLSGFVYLNLLGRPDASDIKRRKSWYPRFPYITTLIFSVLVAGFYFGKSPNPMESIVKVFKSMVGLYPDPTAKVIAFLFFIALAIIGNKLICGWACPFGSFQELIYSIPILRKIKRRKLPFALTNTIRATLFVLTLLFLFGFIGNRKGFVIYHYINPFNLFDGHFESISILITVIIALVGSFFVYRPFCQIVCPFGFVSWIFERFSITRVHVDMDKCTQCGACIKICPLDAAKGRVYGKKLPADCFSCARCLNVCPVDAVRYESIFKKRITKSDT
ncbi:MAG: 4Fe-4S binding protein [Desulfobacterales bacterium]|nr:4Fe-4S binding protein [Desulfobacterales bacterium]